MANKELVSGAHVIIYSRNADADRRFLRDVLNFPHVDAGHGWLIFALPAAEAAVHPAESESDEKHELYLMCDDLEELTRTLRAQGVECSAPHEQRWGILMEVTLPGGGKLGVYEPRHARPPGPRAAPRKAATRRPRAAGAKPPKRAARRARATRARR
jgi:catechol 2,3-dioxygenase-like lactoylglutathione lyase family enzyme